MANRQSISKDNLMKLLVEHGIIEGIRIGRYEYVIQNESPSHKIPGGKSLIISNYQHGQYLCTIHELRDKNGHVVHQDVEDILINGIRYERE
jgi:hypothetical protein